MEFRFDLDVCADEKNRKCERWLEGPHYEPTCSCFACTCGLCADWLENVCFLNPPYSQVAKWLQKAVEASSKGATVVALLPNNTDVKWYQTWAQMADEIRFVTRRIPFDDQPGNTGGSVILVFWPRAHLRHGPPRYSNWTW